MYNVINVFMVTNLSDAVNVFRVINLPDVANLPQPNIMQALSYIFP